MNASAIIQALISLGGTIKDLATKNATGGSIDWAAVVKSAISDSTIKDDVSKLLGALKASDMGGAIGEIDVKQKALLKGRTLPQLSNPEMLQYDDLADARLLLATNQLKSALDETVAQWLVKDALPVLVDVGPAVLALLL